MNKILIVLSAADTWTRADGSKYESGVWAEEFVVMDEAFVAKGCAVDIATPGGVPPTIDPHSMNLAVVGQEKVDHFRTYLHSVADRLAKPLSLVDIDAGRYDAIVIPGGHGPVEDLYKDLDIGRLLVEADRAGKIIAPVCHGQAALLAAKDEAGGWLFSGRAMTAFSDEEEAELGTADNAPVAARRHPSPVRCAVREGTELERLRGHRRQPAHRPEPRLQRAVGRRGACCASLIRTCRLRRSTAEPAGLTISRRPT